MQVLVFTARKNFFQKVLFLAASVSFNVCGCSTFPDSFQTIYSLWYCFWQEPNWFSMTSQKQHGRHGPLFKMWHWHDKFKAKINSGRLTQNVFLMLQVYSVHGFYTIWGIVLKWFKYSAFIVTKNGVFQAVNNWQILVEFDFCTFERVNRRRLREIKALFEYNVILPLNMSITYKLLENSKILNLQMPHK